MTGYFDLNLHTSDGGEGLPAYPTATVAEDLDDGPDPSVYLFTCVRCGHREANPPAPLAGCSCGGDIVAHQFHYQEYNRIREFGDPRPDAGDDGREVVTDGGRDVDAIESLADRMAENLCLGFQYHDQRERERAVEAFARVDALQFAHVGVDVAREAARAYVDALWAKDELESEYTPDGEDDPDLDQLADADWSTVEQAFAERASLLGINRAYAGTSTTAWRRHKIGGDYWTPMLLAQSHELRAAMQDPEYPEKPHQGLSGFGPEAVRYLLGVELHDMHTESHWKEAQRVMIPYFERILQSHDHLHVPEKQRDTSEEQVLVADGGCDEGKSWLTCGDRVRDRDNEDDDAYVYVVEQLEEQIDEYVLYTTDSGTEQTVYDYTRGEYDADEPVVRVVFEESLTQFLEDSTLTRDEVLDICHDLDIETLDTRDGFLKVYAYPRSRLERPRTVTDGGVSAPPDLSATPGWNVKEAIRGPEVIDEGDCCDRCGGEYPLGWEPFFVFYENGVVESLCAECKPPGQYVAGGEVVEG